MSQALSQDPASSVAALLSGLRFRDLGVEFTVGNKTLEVLRSINITVPQGQFCAILGPSGCGKSTLLSITAGLVSEYSGSVEFNAKVVRGINPAIGYMFQKDTLLPWLTAQRNVALPLEIAPSGRGRSQINKRASDLMRLVGLEGFENHLPRELSGGMRKRVQLARLIAQDPQILLLDEPFGALDAMTKLLIQGEFLNLWDDYKQTVLFVTHDIQEAITLSDRVILLSARPGMVKGDWAVPLPRPRNPATALANPVFIRLFDEIWNSVRAEM